VEYVNVVVMQCFCSGESSSSEDNAQDVDEEVQQLNREQQLDNKVHHSAVNHLTEGTDTSEKIACSQCENGSDVSETGADESSTNVGDRRSPEYSLCTSDFTTVTDSMCSAPSENCEQSSCVTESNEVSNGMSLTPQRMERSPCNSTTSSDAVEVVDSATKHFISSKMTTTKENKQNLANSEDCPMLTEVSDDKKAEIAGCADVEANGCDAVAPMDSVTCQDTKVKNNAMQVDSLQPLDFSVSGLAKTGNCTTRKFSETRVPDDVQKNYRKHDVKSDSCRPVGRLLHDLGLELVREQVYRDLIDIQTVKNAKNRLEEREKGQLLKLIEAQERLALRNAPYQLPVQRCSRCNFMSPSTNVMTLHHQFGTVSRIDATMHVCCLCSGQPGFRTRNAAQFTVHLTTAHGLDGRLMKKMAPYACKNCMFEHKSAVRLAVHVEKCVRKFSLATNLQPLPGDCDIPLMYRSSDRRRQDASPVMQSSTSSTASSSADGPPSVRTLLSSVRHQMSAGNPGRSYNQPLMPSLICEICGKLVDGREALWSHFRAAHHVELCRVTMRDKEPWMKCDVCSGRFWTYQGLSRHLLLAHNRALATSFTSATPASPVVARCHLCGGSQTSNPLSHFSAYHNVTLLEMYHAKLCCLCNRKVNSGRAFEEHMVEQHSDIFANYDVLRTVLQALTTARYFKADDTREPTTQHITQLSARGGQSAASSSVAPCNVRQKFPEAAQTATTAGWCRNYAAADMADKKSVMATPRNAQTLQRKHNSSGVVSAVAGQRKRSNTHVSVTKNKCTKSGSSCAGKTHVPETQISAVKANDKSATAEEVKKLYEDLANIGRPILRSMRRKLSTNSDPTNVGSADSTRMLAASVQNNSISTQEIQAKKVHLQSTDIVCDDKTKNMV